MDRSVHRPSLTPPVRRRLRSKTDRESGLLKRIEEVKEPSSIYGEDKREHLLQRRWQDLAREQASAKEREVLLLYDTIRFKLPPSPGRARDERGWTP